MTKGARTLAAIVGGVVLLGAAALVVFLGPVKAERTRANVLASAQYYLDKGDYGRALDLLDKLLIDNASDADAKKLRDRAVLGKSGSDTAAAAQLAQAEATGQKAIA
jgi:hypothetical protein